MTRKSKFSENWLVNLTCNGWVSKKCEFAGMCLCFKYMNISKMGEKALKTHKKSKNIERAFSIGRLNISS